MNKKILVLIPLSIGLMSCSLMQSRSSDSGYSAQAAVNTPQKDYYQSRRDYEYDQAKEYLGYAQSKSLSEGQQRQVKYKMRLKRMEKNIESQATKKQYYQLKPFMKNDVQRIQFLSIPTMEARKRWAIAKGISINNDVFNPDVIGAIEKSDIILGMTKKAVRESWGEPDSVEVSGNSLFGNERWSYEKYVSQSDGYNKENRVIYFEAGKVAGWDKQ